MKKIISFNLTSSRALLANINQIISQKKISDSISYFRIGEELHFTDMSGPDLICGLKVALVSYAPHIGIFLDLRLLGTKAEVKEVMNKYFAPDLLTVSSACSVATIEYLRKSLPGTKLVMVSTLSDVSPEECHERFGLLPEEKIFLEYNAIRKLYQRKISGRTNPEPFDMIFCRSAEINYLLENISACQFIVQQKKNFSYLNVFQIICLNDISRQLSTNSQKTARV